MNLNALAAEVEAARRNAAEHCAELAAEKWIRVMCDYCAEGVWALGGSTSPIYLPIDLPLIARIFEWQKVYEEFETHYTDTNPTHDPDYLAWAEEGFQIAMEVKRQLLDWTVIYHDDRRSVPSLAGHDWIELCSRLRPWFEYEISDAVMRSGLPPDNYPSDLPVLPE